MEYLTIEQVAKVINRSEQTVRRMIKNGKLKAELRDSPYGKQYMIPSSEVNASHAIVDVVNISRAVSLPEIINAVTAKLIEENASIRKELEEIKETQNRIESAINERDKKLMEIIRERQKDEQNKIHPWWKFW